MNSVPIGANHASAVQRPPIVTVIVTFNPDLGTLRAMIDALLPQVDRILLVDNASAAEALARIRMLASEYSCGLEALRANLGIGAAQNRGLRALMAEEGGACASNGYVLFLDHDSIPAEDMVDLLIASDLRMRASGVRVGAVGPAIVDHRTGTTGRFVCSGDFLVRRVKCKPECGELNVDFLISSGTLVRIDTFLTIGEMNEELFIDHVDTEWCLRAKAAGYALFGVCAARLTHSLGDDVVHVWFGRMREVFVHSPTRDYYMCRNTLLILRKVRMSLGWRIFLVGRLAASIVFFGVTQPPRLRRFRCMLAGLRDGFRNRQGKMSAS
ncbi:glycosyltransferase family 2 protein [Paraburkholderia bryophila]|uniref:Rhamnosyltransferase n=1 Tax=Paraburkholderia bryophila TaxID=420952 RepID=A0A7Y9WL36_9BURK|nr:glycosyltransferase family 2 protein [Paraburkholderia bryophila]NYH22318.1 rhamnosyltransferase [Paraburkholderia bryophila]